MACNSSYKGSSVLFWPLETPALIYTLPPHTHSPKIHFFLEINEIVDLSFLCKSMHIQSLQYIIFLDYSKHITYQMELHIPVNNVLSIP